MPGSGPPPRRRHRRLFQALLPTVYRACSLALDFSHGAEWTVFPSLFRTVIRFLGLLCQKRSLHRGKAALLTFQLLPLWPPGQQITSHTHALRESEFVYPDRCFFGRTGHHVGLPSRFSQPTISSPFSQFLIRNVRRMTVLDHLRSG